MNFPLLPLFDVLGVLSDLNIGLSIFVVGVSFIVSVMYLVPNAYGSDNYKRANARTGLINLGVAVFVAIVGVVNIVTFIGAVYLLYFLGYWVLYRFLIKNIMAAWPKKSKNTENIDITD